VTIDTFNTSSAIEPRTSKSTLRKAMRARRSKLTVGQQKQAARALVRKMKSCQPAFFRGRWALYMSHQGEIDTSLLAAQLARRKCQIFFPVLHPVYHNRLVFVRMDQAHAAGMVINKYGINEPSLKQSKTYPAWSMNVICLPLVAFDCSGNRLGMGGGYYDRSLANNRLIVRSPILIGVAHHFQQVNNLPRDSWDIPLHAIVTDKAVKYCRKTHSQALTSC